MLLYINQKGLNYSFQLVNFVTCYYTISKKNSKPFLHYLLVHCYGYFSLFNKQSYFNMIFSGHNIFFMTMGCNPNRPAYPNTNKILAVNIAIQLKDLLYFKKELDVSQELNHSQISYSFIQCFLRASLRLTPFLKHVDSMLDDTASTCH